MRVNRYPVLPLDRWFEKMDGDWADDLGYDPAETTRTVHVDNDERRIDSQWDEWEPQQ